MRYLFVLFNIIQRQTIYIQFPLSLSHTSPQSPTLSMRFLPVVHHPAVTFGHTPSLVILQKNDAILAPIKPTNSGPGASTHMPSSYPRYPENAAHCRRNPYLPFDNSRRVLRAPDRAMLLMRSRSMRTCRSSRAKSLLSAARLWERGPACCLQEAWRP